MGHRYLYRCPAALSVTAILTVACCSTLPAQEMATTTQAITVTGEPVATPHPHDDTRPKLEHIMREVSDTQITVTKKATAIKLDQQPTIIDNNLQSAFNNAPGVLITEQQTPGEFNISYRGLGNPQESEYTLVLQDGIPLMSDWIGFPTLYYLPLPQSVSEIQVIRGGSSLLYGPEPAPAINYVTRRPAPGSPMHFSTEQVGGGYGLYSTYNVIQGTSGPFEYRADFGYAHKDGQRDNSESELWQADLYLGYRPDEHQLLALDFHGYQTSVGDPGRLTIQEYDRDRNYSPTPFAHDWVDRYNVTLSYENQFGENWLFQGKAWFTFQEIDNRTSGVLSPTGALPAVSSRTILNQDFTNGGVDLRMRYRWGRGNALTFGGVAYHGDSPYQQFLNANLSADRDAGGTPRIDQDRATDYQAVFVENVFRFGPFHIVPSFRLDHETVEVSENVSPFRPRPGKPLTDVSADRTVPLWGIGFGNDFGKGNETYFSASSGWRPTRYFDVVSPFSATFVPGQPSDPFKSLDIELGVHGTPIAGLWYDIGLFWMEFTNRTESVALNPGVNTDTILINSGSTRHRGVEGELSYDFLAPFQAPSTRSDSKDGKDTVAVPSRFAGMHLILSGNLQLLDAEFTDSELGFEGNEPAFAPHVIGKAALTFRKDHCFNFRLSATSVSEQFFQDSNLPATAGATVLVPAKLPSYWTLDFGAEYYVTKHMRLLGGVSNLTDENYYSRVFSSRIEPAPRRTGYAGLSVEF
jgi:Fe(3+) dicitrate transport protein